MKIDLTQKRHQNFEQLASRLDCTLEDIRYLIVEGELTPSYFLPAGRYAEYVMLPAKDYDSTGQVSPNQIGHERDVDDEPSGRWLNGFHYLVLPNRTGARHCQFNFVASQSSSFDIADLVYEMNSAITIDDVMNEGVVMATEVDRLLRVKTGSQSQAERSLSTKERNSLLKMVIGMAIKGYKYDPKASKNTAIEDIVGDIEALGMSITDDTVRRYLQEAGRAVLEGTKGP